MEILSKVVNGLERCYSVLISKKELDAVVAEKLKETAKGIRIDGFRPGKVPLDLALRMHGDTILSESKKQLVDNVSKEIIKDEKLVISLNYMADLTKDDENGLEFSLRIEAVPSFELKDISNIEIKKHIVRITDDDIHKTIEAIRKKHKKWIEDKDSLAIEKGHKVVVDLKLQTTARKLKNNKINDLEIVVGDETIVADFWTHIIGAKVGDTKEFSVEYSEDFFDKNLAGKNVKYNMTIKKVFIPAEYELDDDFAQSVGYENLEKLRESAKSRLASTHERMTKDIMRRDLLDKISDMYDFDIPKNLMEIENKEIIRQIKEESKRLGKEFTPHIQEECHKITAKKIRLGFVISEIAKKEKIHVTNNEVTQSISNIAAMYPERAKEIWKIYTRGSAASAVANSILEKKVVEFLLSKIKTNEVECSAVELVALDEEPFDFFKDKSEKVVKKSGRASKSKNSSSDAGVENE
ncbi:MAG: trigger factor [Holosporaceae bacterium]|jgi:trigger factor|nr:trigger factor [Holosporaceae bacterium]